MVAVVMVVLSKGVDDAAIVTAKRLKDFQAALRTA
jgi:hypothetical protein